MSVENQPWPKRYKATMPEEIPNYKVLISAKLVAVACSGAADVVAKFAGIFTQTMHGFAGRNEGEGGEDRKNGFSHTYSLDRGRI